jgi:hypothetical protein
MVYFGKYCQSKFVVFYLLVDWYLSYYIIPSRNKGSFKRVDDKTSPCRHYRVDYLLGALNCFSFGLSINV